MRVLGVGGLDHNGSLTVWEDGNVIAFLECERVVRLKNAGLDSPERLNTTLGALGVGEVDAIGVADLGLWAQRKGWLQGELSRRFPNIKPSIWHHHDCHAAAAFSTSPFERATCVTIDGKGDGLSTTAAQLDQSGEILPIFRVGSASSLGRLWWAVSEYCGLPGHHSAGKVMALAAYGTPRTLFDGHVDLLGGGGFRIVPGAEHPDTFRQVARIVQWLESLLGRPAGKLDADLAASVQALTVRVVCHVVGGAVAATGEDRVCLSGGVALNGLANQALLDRGIARDLFVPPCTDDRGLSVGAAALSDKAAWRHHESFSPFLGPLIEPTALPEQWMLVNASPCHGQVAKMLTAGHVVAVCIGRDEAGPRALGHRSMLVSPVDSRTRDRVNSQLKQRETFRPFGCVVPLTEAGRWFHLRGSSPYMLRIARARADRAELIPAVLHEDGTSRVQTVTEHGGSGLWPILAALSDLGHPPVLLNTSLNRRGEPLAHTVTEAAAAATAMGLDYLLTDTGLYERKI